MFSKISTRSFLIGAGFIGMTYSLFSRKRNDDEHAQQHHKDHFLPVQAKSKDIVQKLSEFWPENFSPTIPSGTIDSKLETDPMKPLNNVMEPVQKPLSYALDYLLFRDVTILKLLKPTNPVSLLKRILRTATMVDDYTVSQKMFQYHGISTLCDLLVDPHTDVHSRKLGSNIIGFLASSIPRGSFQISNRPELLIQLAQLPIANQDIFQFSENKSDPEFESNIESIIHSGDQFFMDFLSNLPHPPPENHWIYHHFEQRKSFLPPKDDSSKLHQGGVKSFFHTFLTKFSKTSAEPYQDDFDFILRDSDSNISIGPPLGQENTTQHVFGPGIKNLLETATILAFCSRNKENVDYFLSDSIKSTMIEFLENLYSIIYSLRNQLGPPQKIENELVAKRLESNSDGSSSNLTSLHVDDYYSAQRMISRVERQLTRILANLAAHSRQGPEMFYDFYHSSLFRYIVQSLNSPYNSVRSEGKRALFNLSHKVHNRSIFYQDGMYVLNNLEHINRSFKTLEVLSHKPDQNASFDIVFLHGLLGGAIDTWTNSNNICWPTEFLSHDFPNCRLLSVGYDTHVTTYIHKSPGSSIEDLATQFILPRLLNSQVGRERPIIFVTHSLGGLLLQTLLHHCRKDVESQHIYQNTAGIVYYSVPLRGSKLATFATTMYYLLFPTPIVQQLSSSSETLKQLGSLSGFLSHVPTLSFGETQECIIPPSSKKYYIKTLVVPPQSANPGYGEFHLIDTNHFHICKPSDLGDPRYQLVVEFISNIKDEFSDL